MKDPSQTRLSLYPNVGPDVHWHGRQKPFVSVRKFDRGTEPIWRPSSYLLGSWVVVTQCRPSSPEHHIISSFSLISLIFVIVDQIGVVDSLTFFLAQEYIKHIFEHYKQRSKCNECMENLKPEALVSTWFVRRLISLVSRWHADESIKLFLESRYSQK